MHLGIHSPDRQSLFRQMGQKTSLFSHTGMCCCADLHTRGSVLKGRFPATQSEAKRVCEAETKRKDRNDRAKGSSSRYICRCSQSSLALLAAKSSELNIGLGSHQRTHNHTVAHNILHNSQDKKAKSMQRRRTEKDDLSQN